MKRSVTTGAALACGLALITTPALAANAATGPRTAAGPGASVSTDRPAAPHSKTTPAGWPHYFKKINITLGCAEWKGELAWGGTGGFANPGFIDISGRLGDGCHSGYAQLFAHWDTINNPKWELVKKVGARHSDRTPYSTHDDENTYKDIYVYVCVNYHGYRCSRHYGPGA